MSTAIQWCHIPGYAPEVWNPTTGCTSNGTGCDLCYARTLTNMRHKAYKAGKLQKMPHYAHPFSVVQQHPGRLANPLKVKRPTCYFVNSMSDLFHEEVPFSFVDQVFAVMAMCPQHIFIILTKRPERMSNYTRGDGDHTTGNHYSVRNGSLRHVLNAWELAAANLRPGSGHPSFGGKYMFPDALPNVWMGFSASNQDEFTAGINHLKNTYAAKRIVSLEPLVAPVTMLGWTHVLDWVILGGESGTTKQKPRPMHPLWEQQVREECAAAGVAYFRKQWGAYAKGYHADPKRNIVMLSNGDFAPYTPMRGEYARFAFGTTYQDECDFAALHPVGMHRASKHTNGHLLDGKEEFAWPINEERR